jgi:pimeloyl-ACP methyl ester carboxylesterase
MSTRPGEERRVRSFDGTDLSVHVVGPTGTSPSDGAPTLVFVHGLTLDLTAWYFQWRDLSPTHRCILYDQRGHGRSGPSAGSDYSLEALGRDVRAVLDATCPDGPAVLIGHSLGGMSIMAFAEQFPEEFGRRVAGVVLTDTSSGAILETLLGEFGSRVGTGLLPWTRRLASRPERLQRLRARIVRPGSAIAYLGARITNFGPDAPPSVVDHVIEIASRVPLEVWTDLMASLVQLDQGEALGRITVPALVVVGELDRLTPPSSARALVEALPEGRGVVIPRAGHCAMLERHEEFNEEVEKFVLDLPPPIRPRRRARKPKGGPMSREPE